MGAEAIGSLYAQLGIDTGRFDSGLDKVEGRLGKFGKIDFNKGLKAGLGEVDDVLKGLAGNAGAFGDIMSGLGIGGVAVAASLAVAFSGARDAMAFGDDIADTANKLKVTTDYLQEMRYTAHGLGGDFQDADDAIEAFTKNFGLATSGLSAKAVKPFEALGLDPKSFATTQEALDAVIAKIAGLGSAAEQAAVADKLGLTPMLPAIREGTAAIDDMRQAAHEIGYVMDADLIEKAGEANDKFESLTAVLDVQFKSAMVDAIPLVMQLTQMMVDGAKWAGDFASSLNDAAAAFDRLSTHDLSGKEVGNDRDRLFARMQQQQAGRQASSLSGWLNPKYDRVLSGQALAAGNLSSVLGGAKEKPDDLKNLQEQNDRLAGARKAAGEAARLAAAAERVRAAALKAEADALHDAEQKSADYLAGLMEEVGTMGMSSDQLKRRKIEMEAAAAPTEALANQIRAVGAEWVSQAKVNDEAAEKQKAIKDQISETVTTLYDLIGTGPHFTTTLESMAMDLDDASHTARQFAYDIDDIARAINGNDWTSAMGGLVSVLANVEKAFAKAGTAQDKFSAIAGIAQGIGGAVGGTGGAALSGAASGALAGFTTFGVPGAIIGGIGGLVSGIFGSSKAKKQAKAQAKAEAEAKEQQRQQQISDIRMQQQIGLLRAQGKEQEAVNLERQNELDVLRKLDASLVAGQQAMYDYADAGDLKAIADAKASAEADKRADIQGRIDDLTMTDAQKLAKKRSEERAQVMAMTPALGEMLDQLFGIEDASSQAAEALAEQQAEQQALQAQQQAWLDAVHEQQRLDAYLAEQTAKASADAVKANQDLLDSIRAITGASADQEKSYRETAKSLKDFADSLSGVLGGTFDQLSYDAARQALLTAKGDDITTAGQAFLAVSERTQSSADYARDTALVRSRALGGSAKAKTSADNSWIGAALFSAALQGLDASAVMDSIISGPPRNPSSGDGYAQMMTANAPKISGVANNDNSTAALRVEIAQLRDVIGTGLAQVAKNTEDTNLTLLHGTLATKGG